MLRLLPEVIIVPRRLSGELLAWDALAGGGYHGSLQVGGASLAGVLCHLTNKLCWAAVGGNRE